MKEKRNPKTFGKFRKLGNSWIKEWSLWTAAIGTDQLQQCSIIVWVHSVSIGQACLEDGGHCHCHYHCHHYTTNNGPPPLLSPAPKHHHQTFTTISFTYSRNLCGSATRQEECWCLLIPWWGMSIRTCKWIKSSEGEVLSNSHKRKTTTQKDDTGDK